VTITTTNIEETAKVLTDIFGYRLVEQHVNRFRFVTDAVDNANIVDLVEAPGERAGHVAKGSVHHIAFRVANDDILMEFRKKVLDAGLQITDKIDRNYFYSLYFREPGGVLFEIASDNPGFATDETVEQLGSGLMLPPQYEPRREQIVKVLPILN
jgi:glyoxalase family protein